MKKSVLVFSLYLLLAFQVAFAAGKPGRSTLKATISAQQTTISELEADNVELFFSLTNTGKEPIELHSAASHLFVNGKEVKGWILTPQSGFGGGNGGAFSGGNSNMLMLAPGQMQRFSGSPLDYFHKPGTYKIVWKSAAFQSAPLKIRVLRDRVKPAGQEPKHFALIRAIRAMLPSGWEAFSRKDYLGEGVRIIRLQPVMQAAGSSGINSDGGRLPDSIDSFEFSLQTEPFVSPTYYRQIKIDNALIRQKLIELDKEMKDIPTRKGEYHPETPEHMEKVAEYNRLRIAIRQLPEYYYRDVSLNFYNFQQHNQKYNYYSVRDKAIRAECREVTQRVISLLSSYEPQKPLPLLEDED